MTRHEKKYFVGLVQKNQPKNTESAKPIYYGNPKLVIESRRDRHLKRYVICIGLFYIATLVAYLLELLP